MTFQKRDLKLRKTVRVWLIAGLPFVEVFFQADETAKPKDGISAEALAILTDTLPEEAYVQRENCIPTRKVRKVDILDSSHVLVVTGKDAWLNRATMKCRGLRPGNRLEITRHVSRLCRHDTMLARETGIPAPEDFPPRCHLGAFERVELEQADMLREQFRQLRKARRSGRVQDSDRQANDADTERDTAPDAGDPS